MEESRFNDHSKNIYEFLKNAYYGSGGFGNGNYLEMHPRETPDRFNTRKNLSYYPNYVKPCVNAHVDPIFKEWPIREFEKNELFNGFLNDVDGKKTTLDRFMKKVALKAKLFGYVFILIDNDTEIKTNLKDAIENRKYPYLITINRNQVSDWSFDKFGNLNMLQYSQKFTNVSESGDKETETITWKWTNTKWVKQSGSSTEEGENSIGIIPIVPVFGAVQFDETELPHSEFYQIAKSNLSIFNACSELRERNRNQAFSLLTYPVGENDQFDEVAEGLTVGDKDMLMYRGTKGPEYITPSAEPSQMLLDEVKFMVEEIYRMAERANVTGVQEQNSGVAKEWDNQGLFQSIAEFAKNLEEAEEKIAFVFGKYINKDLKFNSTYNYEYGINDAIDLISEITEVLNINVSPTFAKEIKKKLVRALLKDLDDDVVNKILGEIDTQADDAYFSEKENTE